MTSISTKLPTIGADFLQSLLTRFPATGVTYSFAYGSAVFAQKNQKIGKMVDLIFVVDNPVKWHQENLSQNPSHYSSLRWFGANRISKIQETWACGVYYNPFVNIDGQLLKYGVISTSSLLSDLKNWNHLYIAGRLHKPVRDLKAPTNSHILDYIKLNRDFALRAALLQLPRYSTKFELCHSITELSYMGDFRMSVGENPNKVLNIVTPMVPEFDKIYYPLVDGLKPFVIIDKDDRLVQETHPKARFHHLMNLPYDLQRSLARKTNRPPERGDIEEAMYALSYSPSIGNLVRKSVSEIVWRGSIYQTIQGIFTAGPIKSVRYGLEKLKKKTVGKSESQQGVQRQLLTSVEIHELEAMKNRETATATTGTGSSDSNANISTPSNSKSLKSKIMGKSDEKS